MKKNKIQPAILLKDLALIGDQKTCAYLNTLGTILWYCPKRFDNASVFAGLLDQEKGGSWSLEAEKLTFKSRYYLDDSAILATQLETQNGDLQLLDWMPMNSDFTGICRMVSEAKDDIRVKINLRPEYGQRSPEIFRKKEYLSIDNQLFLYSSHTAKIHENSIEYSIKKGEKAWIVLADQVYDFSEEVLRQSKQQTLDAWKKLATHLMYQGPFEKEVKDSIRMIRLMSYAENGGVIAAGTTSLPEVLGGSRNYDYRYVWLRDAAMIVSALTRAGSDGEEERKFLSFICSSMHSIQEPTVPMFTLHCEPAPSEQEVELAGYGNSQPIRIGNNANSQLQLDAISNVLIGAKVIYKAFDTLEHWETVSNLADYLVAHWNEPDHGIWEETPKEHYTTSKVITAISLKYIAEHCQDEKQKKSWLETSKKIRQYIEETCLTDSGAYAVYAGSQNTDVSAILFPIWGYCDPDTLEMLKTIEVLEKNYCKEDLYYRHLEDYTGTEGAFLAGTFWVAQYWIMRENWEKFNSIMKAALAFMNDVGMMPEEGDPDSGLFLGNLPQTFVHASLIGAVVDYRDKMANSHD